MKKGQWEWRKIKWIFGRKRREALIQKFERCNGDIAKFVEQWEILAPLSKSRRPGEASKYHHTVRDNACKVYDALEAGWKCQRSCLHTANLQLERRNSAQSSPLFTIILSSQSHTTRSTSPQQNWLEAHFSIDELDEQIRRDGCHQANISFHSGNELLPAQPSYGSSTRRTVSSPDRAAKRA